MATTPRTRSELAVGRWRPAISALDPDPPGYTEMLNCWAAPRLEGVIEAAPGFFSISEAGENLRAVVYAKATDGTKLLLAVGATKLFSVSLEDATYGQFTELATGLTYGQRVGYFLYGNTIFLFNGSTPKKITVEATPVVSDIGLDRPGGDGVGAEGSDNRWQVEGGLATARQSEFDSVRGIVKYWISEIVESGGDIDESALSVSFGKINSRGRAIEITFDPTALVDPTEMENKRFRIYRTFGDGADPFFLGEQEVETTAVTFVDNTHDDDLGDPPEHHGDKPPDELLPVAVHLERAFGATGSDLYYSDVQEPESWFVSAAGNLISVFKDDGDEITALGTDRAALVIWKRDHMYLLLGQTEEEFVLERITQRTQQSRNLGTPSVWSVAAIPGGFIFYWSRAVYTYFNGRINRVSEEIESELPANLSEHEDQIHMGYDAFNGRAWLSIPVEGATSSHTYFYSFRRQAWVGRMGRGFKAYQYIEDSQDRHRLWALGVGTSVSRTQSDTIYQLLEQGIGFDGEGFTVDLKRSLFDPGRGSLSRFLFVDPDIPAGPSLAPVSIETTIDGNPLTTRSKTITPPSTGTLRRVKHYIRGIGRHLCLRYEAPISGGGADRVWDGTDYLVDENGNNIAGPSADYQGFQIAGQSFGYQKLGSIRR